MRLGTLFGAGIAGVIAFAACKSVRKGDSATDSAQQPTFVKGTQGDREFLIRPKDAPTIRTIDEKVRLQVLLDYTPRAGVGSTGIRTCLKPQEENFQYGEADCYVGDVTSTPRENQAEPGKIDVVPGKIDVSAAKLVANLPILAAHVDQICSVNTTAYEQMMATSDLQFAQDCTVIRVRMFSFDPPVEYLFKSKDRN